MMKKNIQIFLCIASSILTYFCTSPKVTLSMCVKNEANKYLRNLLEEVKYYIDEAVFIDDASTDNTVEVIHEILKDIPVHIISNISSKFSNETLLRQQQWNETIKYNPEWILVLDADQIFEHSMRQEIKKLTEQTKFDVWGFREYDFWSKTHYRDDNFWSAHTRYRIFLVRYKKDFNYTWRNTPQHCGSFPRNVCELPTAYSNIRVKHYGWATAEDRITKYKRYMQLDPGGKYGWQAQYDSILDTNPHLLEWAE